MSMRADIESDFKRAIDAGIGSEEGLLQLKLDVYESLEWDGAVTDTAKDMKAKGYKIPGWLEDEDQYHGTMLIWERKMDIVRIKKYSKDHSNGYARVEYTDMVKGVVVVSNMNQPFQGTFAFKELPLNEVEFVEGIGA